MKITFLEGCLEVSNTTLAKIPYFAALLNVNPDLETTHLDFRKDEFLEIIESLETSLSDYLGLSNLPSLPSLPSLPEPKKPKGFIFKDEQIDNFDENDYYLIYLYPSFKIFGDIILKSKKENYKFNIIIHESKLGIVYNNFL